VIDVILFTLEKSMPKIEREKEKTRMGKTRDNKKSCQINVI
jgi:hypothetical protein